MNFEHNRAKESRHKTNDMKEKTHHLYPDPKGIGVYPEAKPINVSIYKASINWKQSLIAYMAEPEFKVGDTVYLDSVKHIIKSMYKHEIELIIVKGQIEIGWVYPSQITHYPPGHVIPSSECVFVEEVKIGERQEPHEMKTQHGFYESKTMVETLEWQPVEEPQIKDSWPGTKQEFNKWKEFRSKCLSGVIRIKETKKGKQT